MNALTIEDVNEVSGGVTWGQVGVGLAAISLGIAVVSTGGLAGLSLGLIAGAGFGGDFAMAAFALGLAGSGGFAVGAGLRD